MRAVDRVPQLRHSSDLEKEELYLKALKRMSVEGCVIASLEAAFGVSLSQAEVIERARSFTSYDRIRTILPNEIFKIDSEVIPIFFHSLMGDEESAIGIEMSKYELTTYKELAYADLFEFVQDENIKVLIVGGYDEEGDRMTTPNREGQSYNGDKVTNHMAHVYLDRDMNNCIFTDSDDEEILVDDESNFDVFVFSLKDNLAIE